MAHGPLARANFASTSAHERNTARPVVLIGFRRAENLGLGYLASTLRARGYRVEILEFEDTVENIVAAVRRHDPILVGFSLIFQFYIERYAALIRTLRTHGVNAHFTIGGHFPTLSYRHTLDLIPELDSVVRFEGESTLLELADCLSTARPWTSATRMVRARPAPTSAIGPMLARYWK